MGDWTIIFLVQIDKSGIFVAVVGGSFILNILYSTWAAIVSFLLKSIFKIINSFSLSGGGFNTSRHWSKKVFDTKLFLFFSSNILIVSVISIVTFVPYITIDLLTLCRSFFSKISSPTPSISSEISLITSSFAPIIFEI